MKRRLGLLFMLLVFACLSGVAFAANIQYTYDNLNRLIKVDYGNGRAIQYSYDQDGNRITQTINAAGSIVVTISPQAAADAGAEWSVDSGALQTSGATVSDLGVGQHTVTFSDVSGWTTPGSQNVSISDGQTASVSGTYVQQAGSLTVAISPQGAIDAGAEWNVDGGSWQSSGAIVSSLGIGQHTVSFKNISGWNTPANQTASVTSGQTASLTGAYVQMTGSLSVTLSPAGAITAGAKWNVDGGSWQDSGATVSALSTGQHTVSFNSIPGWNTPANQSASVTSGQTTSLTGTYAQQTGPLTVTINPSAAVSAGAMWAVDGGPWQSSGAIVSDLSVGQHTVSFKNIAGWSTPANQTATIASGQTAFLGCAYAKKHFPSAAIQLLLLQ